MRWELLDKFEVLKKGSHSLARKSFSGSEDFFEDHFPGKPLVPETLCVEMIAQAGGVLFGLGLDFRKEVILAKVSEAEFLREVAPPCEFLVEAALEEEREEGAWVRGTVMTADKKPVARARILLVTMDSLDEGLKKQIVFNEKFIKHYDIYAVARKSEALS